MKIAPLERFVRPYYAQKDAMHDLSHIKRFLTIARSLSKRYHADPEVLTCAAYFHGIDQRKHRSDLTEFLESQGLSRKEAERVLQAAFDSQKESRPKTLEGKILHDAHLIEGGKTWKVTKFLVTGTLRGRSLREIVDSYGHGYHRKLKCYLPETRRAFSEKEKFTREFFRELKRNL